jgi:hypothetical protein
VDVLQTLHQGNIGLTIQELVEHVKIKKSKAIYIAERKAGQE